MTAVINRKCGADRREGLKRDRTTGTFPAVQTARRCPSRTAERPLTADRGNV
jgi:hypothetical protein